MPNLHLPASHQVEDLILAHRVAEAVGSEDLYVSWSHEAGAGQRPEVSAAIRDEPSVVVEAIASILGWISSALAVIAPARRPTAGAADAPAEPARREPAT